MKKKLEISYEELLQIIRDRIPGLPENPNVRMDSGPNHVDILLHPEDTTLYITVDIPLPEPQS